MKKCWRSSAWFARWKPATPCCATRRPWSGLPDPMTPNRMLSGSTGAGGPARAPALFPLRLFGIAYTDIFRGLPVVLVIYIIGFGIPGLGLPRPWNSPYIWGTLALVLVYSAYVAEVIRSGIDSIHQSQRSAAASLGLSDQDTMRFVVLPQAIRNVVPANMDLFIALQKDVALLSFIGPVEIFRQAGVYKSLYANFTPYVGAALIFLALTIPATRYADYLMNKQNRART